MKYFKKLEGERIYLSPVNTLDIEIYTKWLNNPDITKYLTIHNSFVTLGGEKVFLENTQKNEDELVLGIIKSENDTLMGNIGLTKIDYKCGTAELGIFIGDEENLGKGYGSEAINLLIEFAFNELRLHNIMLTVYDFNERAQKAYQKCGFKEIGRRHEARFYNGKYYDIIYMEIINSNI